MDKVLKDGCILINVKEYIKRGLIFSGLGPVVAGIVYMIIEKSGIDLN